jgi:hypothetical protein
MIRAAATMLAAGVAALPPTAPAESPSTVLPPYAAILAEQPLPTGPAAWQPIDDGAAWAALIEAGAGGRQAARWRFAGGLIADGRADAALGILDVMVADDPDLVLVPAWQRARGVALAQGHHPAPALAALDDPALDADAESCLWRMDALASGARDAEALAQLRCALPAINARPPAARRRFILAAATSAVALGRTQPAGAWLALLPDGDPAANLLRGKLLLATGDAQAGLLRIARVAISGTPVERADARLSAIEAALAARRLSTTGALDRLDALVFTWRGDAIERRALRLSLRLSLAVPAPRRALAAGAALFRYNDLGAEGAPLLTMLQTQLATALAPGSGLPLDAAAGLFWDYRDLAPGGASGDRLAESLVTRLQDAGLYARAADLLQYRLTKAQDVEQGPLSIRVATLRILSGDPAAAVRALRDTDAVVYPDGMRDQRRQVEAAALDLLGRPAEALAAVQDLAGSGPLRAEIYWRARDWAHLAAVGEPVLPPPGRLGEVGQAVVLRHAIALAMLGREDALAALRVRYRPGFAGQETAAAFDLLTGAPSSADPSAIGKAMAALPTASPAGEMGDLIEQGRAAMTPAG